MPIFSLQIVSCDSLIILYGNRVNGGFPGGSVIKTLRARAGLARDRNADSIPGLGRSPGEENDNPLQYSCLGNPMDRGAWKAVVNGVAKNHPPKKKNSIN